MSFFTLALALIPTLAACAKERVRIESFRATPSWGNGPLQSKLSWKLSGRTGRGVTCRISPGTGGSSEIVIEDCPAQGEAPFTFSIRGRFEPRLTVENAAGQVEQTTRLYVNGLTYAESVVFPEKLSGFTEALVTDGAVELKFSGAAPPMSLGAILWGTSGKGYLRRVVHITSTVNGVILETEQAKLTDAIKEGFFGVQEQTLSLRGATCAGSCEGVRIEHLGPTVQRQTTSTSDIGSSSSALTDQRGGSDLALSVTLPDADLMGAFNRSQVKILVGLRLVDFVVDIYLSTLREFKLELEPRVQMSGKYAISPGAPLAKVPLVKLPFGAIPLGPFVLVPELVPAVQFEYRANSVLNLDTSFRSSVLGGVYFNQGKASVRCEPHFEPQLEVGFGVLSPEQTRTVQMSVFPEVATELFGVAGPYIAPGGYVKADIKAEASGGACMEVRAGMSVAVGAEASVPLLPALDVSSTFNLSEWALASSCGANSASTNADGGTAGGTPTVDGGTAAADGGIAEPERCGGSREAVCGDWSCWERCGESCENCPQDCGECPRCGDESCWEGAGESCGNCPRDCGECPRCGDGSCWPDLGETCATCSQDCGPC